MKMFKKLLSAVLASAMVIGMSIGAWAVPNMNEEFNMVTDQVSLDGTKYIDYQSKFNSRGLTYNDVKSLQNMGFTYEDILKMPQSKYIELLPNKYSGLKKGIIMRANDDAPYNYVKVTNVAGAGGSEYYHPDTDMVKGDFYDDNDGQWIEDQVDDFAKDVYGSTRSINRMYYLWGEWDDNVGTHQGHDMYHKSKNPKIYSAHSGKVISVGTYGRVAIYDSKNDVTYIYAHMDNRKVKKNDIIQKGDLLGYEGKVGANSPHLHFEVRDGRNSSMGDATKKTMYSINPYDYM